MVSFVFRWYKHEPSLHAVGKEAGSEFLWAANLPGLPGKARLQAGLPSVMVDLMGTVPPLATVSAGTAQLDLTDRLGKASDKIHMAHSNSEPT